MKKSCKVSGHKRKGAVVKPHTRNVVSKKKKRTMVSKDMKDYLETRSLKNPKWGKTGDGKIDYKKSPK